MAKYFSIDELIRSGTAARLGIDNTPGDDDLARLEALASRLLDPVREFWGGPLTVNSGYRCPALNAAVGGTARSQHLRGEAADITTGSREGNRRLFGIIAAGAVSFDQLIDERGYSWLHLSWREGGNRNKILHL